MSNPQAMLEVGVDATPSKDGFAEIKAGARDMASAVAEEGRRAAKGVDSIGDGSEAAAQKVDRATSGIISSIRRVTSEQQRLLAEMQTGSQKTSDFFEALSNIRGSNTAALDPLLAKLRDLESQVSVAAAAERNWTETRAFERKAAEAAQLVKASSYVSFWEESLRKAEDAERRLATQNGFIESLKGQAAAIGKTRADLLEMKAAQLGVTQQAAPFIAQLRAQETALRGAGASVSNMTNQLRMVGPQFTDIVTQLAGGQNAMQVFIQQGGQLKDQFGGAGNAARALGGYVGSLITPLTVVAGAAAAIGYAFYQGRQEADLLTRSLISTNGAAGKTVGQLEDIAARISTSVGTQGQAVAALAQLVGNATTATTGDLKQMAEVAVAAQKTLGRSVDDTVKDFEALGRSPVDASLKLNEQYRYLTASVLAQIRALDDQGRATEAAALAQKAYADAMQQQIGSVQQNLGTLERGWNAVTGAAKSAWDAMLNVGRTDAPEQQATKLAEKIASLQAKLERERNTASAMGPGGVNNAELIASLQAQLETAKQQQAIAQENVRLGQRAASSAAERTRLEQAGVVWQMEGDKYLTKRQQMERDIARATQQATAAGISREEVEKRILAIKEKYTDKKSGSSTDTDGARVLSDWTRRIALIDAEAAGTEKLSATEAAYVKVLDDITSGRITLTNAEKAELAVRASAALQLDKQVQLEKDRARAVAEWSKESEKSASDLDRQIAQQREQNEVLGLTGAAAKLVAASKLDLVSATEEVRAATLRENAAYAGNLEEAYRQQADALDVIIQKRREYANLIRSGAAKEAEIESAKASAQAWQRAGEQIEQALTDALMRGFENGKDFGENFIESLRNTIKTAALRLAVQVVVSGASSGVQSLLGAVSGNNGGTAGGLGQYANLASTASSLYGYAGSAAALWSAFAGGAAGGTAGGFTAGWAGGAGSIGSGLSAAGNGYALSGSGQALGGISKVAWPLAVLYGMYMSGKAYDNGFRMDSSTYGGGAWGNVAKSITDTFTLEPLLQKIVGGRAAAILTGSSLGAQIVSKIRSKFGAGGEKIGGEAWSGGQAWDFYTPSNSDSAVGSSVADIRQRISDLATAFGGSSAGLRFGLGFDADPRGKADSRVKAQLYDASGKMVYSALDVGAGRSQEELQAALGAQATRLMIAGLKASNIDSAIKGIFDKLDLATLTDAQAQDALKAAVAMQQLGASVGELWKSIGQNADTKIGSLSNRNALAELFGGVDKLSSSVGSAYDALLTDQQKLDLAQSNLVRHFGELNLAVPQSNAALLSLIEAQDLTSESGRKTYAALISLAPAFAEVQTQLAATATTAASAAQTAADAAAAAYAKLQSDAEAYFRGIDRTANLKSYVADAGSAIDVVFGKVEDGASSAAQASADAAAQAVTAWQSAVSSISGTLQDIRTGSLAALSPEARYSALRDQFGSLTASARGGDASAAQQLGSVAQSFLQASRDYFGSGAAYQADLSSVDSSLSLSLDSAKASVTLQESIQSASLAAVDELQRLNTSLSGFAGEALELLRNGYAGGSRDAAAAAIQQLASLQSTIDYTLASLSSGASMQGNGYKLNKLDNGLAAVQFDNGTLEYIRAGESVLEIAKRIPALRAQWEAMFGIKLPSYDVGTAYVRGDQVAQIHDGETILNTADSNVLRKYGIPTQPDPGLLREVIAELRASRQVQQSGFDVSARRLADLASRLEALEAETRQTRLSAERGV